MRGKRKLYVPVGIPGSGKSIWCARMLDGSRVSSDEIRIELFGSLRAAHDVTPEEKKKRNAQVWERFYDRVYGRLYDENIIADGTNLRDHAREKLRLIAEQTGSEAHVIVFNNSTQAFKQNLERDEDKHVPQDVMNDFLGQFNAEYSYISREPWASYTEICRVA